MGNMAVMWPRALPDWVKSDPRRAAEIGVYNKLQSLLNGEWSVFYSRPWWGIGPKGGEVDGEADFILVHPVKGLLFVEVKGGRIAYSPELQRWQTKDRNAITHDIKDPVLQASTCKHHFLSRLKLVPDWPKGFMRFRHGVIFPDSLPPPAGDIALAGYDKELFCFASEYDSCLVDWVESRLRSHRPAGSTPEIGPGLKGIKVIHELIAKPVQLKVPMLREVQGDLNEMEVLLTGAQMTLIGIVQSMRRVIIEGGAGTGKTILAIEIALREAEIGKKVLLCCRSEPLANAISKKLNTVPGVTVTSFEQLKKIEDSSHQGALAVEMNWNSLLVDEAQDFAWEWWDLIEKIAKSTDASIRIFEDSNQAIYRLRDDLEARLNAVVLPLSVNMRNTKRIAKVTEELYQGPLIQAAGPAGEVPVVKYCEFEEAKVQAIQLVTLLLNEEKVAPSMIAILVPNAGVREEVLFILSRKKIVATDALRNQNNGIVVETVPRFKGLEAGVVILIADKILARNQEQAYVGVSRARSRLFVLGPIEGTPLGLALGKNS